jgi:hypothetical protein
MKKLNYKPKGFIKVNKATTAPIGYDLYTDRKGSRFTPKESKYVLVKKSCTIDKAILKGIKKK